MVYEHASYRYFDGGQFFISQISPKGKRGILEFPLTNRNKNAMIWGRNGSIHTPLWWNWQTQGT